MLSEGGVHSAWLRHSKIKKYAAEITVFCQAAPVAW